ncbi:MAG: LD-carboxypeptidase [Crocinitomicaceae bacterium]|nr:LD-carboxypeptidase [Crocinitomicaceae bacterium]
MIKHIHITSPAKAIDKECIDYAEKYLRERNFEVSLSKHVTGRQNYFSGSDAERLADFQHALDDNSIDAILCARGGYGSVRIIDQLNFDKLRHKNKLIIGFSDITVFHNHVFTHLGIPTLHATVPLNFQTNSRAALDSLVNTLQGKDIQYQIPSAVYNRVGETEAIVVGGNLSILHSLIGTNSDIDTQGKILLIEDIGEAIYAIDRMFWALKKSGKLESLAGLIVGGMTNIKDTEIPFGKKVEEIIAENVSSYSFPVCFNFPAGHIDDNRAVLLGKKAKLHVSVNDVRFFQHGLGTV